MRLSHLENRGNQQDCAKGGGGTCNLPWELKSGKGGKIEDLIIEYLEQSQLELGHARYSLSLGD